MSAWLSSPTEQMCDDECGAPLYLWGAFTEADGLVSIVDAESGEPLNVVGVALSGTLDANSGVLASTDGPDARAREHTHKSVGESANPSATFVKCVDCFAKLVHNHLATSGSQISRVASQMSEVIDPFSDVGN